MKIVDWFAPGPSLAGRLIALVAMALFVILLIAAVVNWWDDVTDWWPWSEEQRTERAERRAVTAELDAAARGHEAEAQSNLTEAERDSAEVVTETRVVTERVIVEAERAPDANQPIAAERADRLRDADRRMCDADPSICP